jgi:hypothetical protein
MKPHFLAIAFVPLVMWTGFAGAGEVSSPPPPSLEGLETMAPEELERFTAEWDASLSKGLLLGPGMLLGRVLNGLGPQNMPPNPRMKYNNPEIVKRVVDLYIAEHQRELKHRLEMSGIELGLPETTEERRKWLLQSRAQALSALERSLEADGDLTEGIPFENRDLRVIGEETEIDYRYVIEAAAASTYSPRIFDYLWTSWEGHDYVSAYYAHVDPERALRLLFDSTPGRRLGEEVYFALLCRSDNGSPMSIEMAMGCVKAIVESQSKLAAQYHDEICGFIRRHGKIYFSAEDPEFSEKYDLLDYRLRVQCLEILERVATDQDVQLIRWLAEDTEHHELEKYASIDEKVQARRQHRSVVPPPSIPDLADRIIQKIQEQKGE